MEGGDVNIVITEENFKYYWKRKKERTPWSYSGLHFVHHKTAAHSDLLSRAHTIKLLLITKTGSAPEQWAQGLSVILE